nr:rep protein [Cressdnaviricota sp.]
MRYRAWCFTVNNYSEDEYKQIQSIECRYLIIGKEVGLQGTPHLQGYIYFNNGKTRGSVSTLIPRAHLEQRLGTHQQAAEYCKKEGSFWEKGEEPMAAEDARKKGGEKSKIVWDLILQHVRKGDTEWVAENYPKVYIQFKARLESLHQPNVVPILGDLLHEWWVGPSGTGKSRLLWELYPEHYEKPLNKWWDGYKHEKVVAIEEWSPANTCTTSSLKRWADRYPFAGEIKGGVMSRLRPLKIIVLSNYRPDQCFLMKEDLEPILRRFTILEFPNDIQRARFRGAWFNNPSPQLEENTEEEPLLPDLNLDSIWG